MTGPARLEIRNRLGWWFGRDLTAAALDRWIRIVTRPGAGHAPWWRWPSRRWRRLGWTNPPD